MHQEGNAIKAADISVLIVARSDRRRQSLKFLLEINPKIKVVGQASDSSLAMVMVRQYRPALMIVDTNLAPAGAWITVLQQVKAESPQTRCLVLANTKQTLPIAKATDADAILMKGFPLANLFTIIEELLSL